MSVFVLNVIGSVASEFKPTEGLTRHANFGEPVWLSEGFAVDLPFDGDPKTALQMAREIASDARLDLNVIPTANRRKKLLVADMDSTIIGVECLDELARMAGLGDKIATITERSMSGEVDFEASLRERVRMLKGVKLSALEQTYAQKVRLNPGARSLIATMRAQDGHTLLISGGFTFFTARVAEAAGFHAGHGNRALDDGVALTGEMEEPLLGRQGKRQILEETAARLGISLEDCLAVGDGANDLAMIEAAGLGVAYHAKPLLRNAAKAVIAHNDLTALLYLQGYTDPEIINPESLIQS